MKKNYIAMGLLGAVFLGNPFWASSAEAAEPPAQTEEKEAAQAERYMYTSQEFGYTIPCPRKPNVIPASALYEGAKGEALIFDNEDYNIKLAWVVFVDAFSDKDVPDFNKLSDKEMSDYLEKLRRNYDDVDIAEIGEKNKALFAVTAKEIEVDTTGDGKPDTVATVDTQTMEVFFRGDKGGRYRIQLINNPQLRPEAMRDCRMAVSMFRETGTTKKK